jgi:uncharacterized protein YnzC (UPF0291/DUF896 family)
MNGEKIKHFFEEFSPRRSELEEKERKGTITDEEKAELLGLRVFPDNPRGAQLHTKEVLGTITEEEKAELYKLRRRKKFSPEINQLFDRVEAGDPNVEQVDTNTGKAVEVTPEGEEKTILPMA